MSNYNAEDIQVLEGLEPVRKRPGMYIGSTDITGLHHLTTEIVNNSVDEALAGYCTCIEITLHENNAISVVDNGRGIPVDIHPKLGISALEVVMTKLHAGGKFSGTGYKVAGGLHGVGAAVTNALSTELTAQVYRNNLLYTQHYKQGNVLAKVSESELPEDHDFNRLGFTSGTKIYFMPDKEIFDTVESDFEHLSRKFREYCYLTPGLMISMRNLRDNNAITYYFESGLQTFLRRLNRGKELLTDVIAISGADGDIEVTCAIQYNNTYTELLATYVNTINTPNGGSHEVGFRTALTRTLNTYAREKNILKEKDNNLTGEDVREGLSAVILVNMPSSNLQFEGQTKTKLGSAEVKPVVEQIVKQKLEEFLQENPQQAQRIIQKSVLAAEARIAARKARETVIRKGALEGSSLPGKLADCQSKDASECEIFIVEGESAGGSAKQGRDRRCQAILPLQGKVLNTERNRLDRILGHEELRDLIVALGMGIGEVLNTAKLRYHKIILMSDADMDGGHIKTLLLTFFFRHMPYIIDNGHLYIAQPPLFKVSVGKTGTYCLSEEERDKLVAKAGDRAVVQRFKGLGEMNADQLWDTTMNPETRILKKVSIDDLEAADHLFTVLMGDEVAPRKRFIQTHSNLAELDI